MLKFWLVLILLSCVWSRDVYHLDGQQDEMETLDQGAGCGCGKLTRNEDSKVVTESSPTEVNMNTTDDIVDLPTLDMVYMAGGETFMGTNKPLIKADGEGPQRNIFLSPYFIDKFAVSNAGKIAFAMYFCSICKCNTFRLGY
jgi:formylglycine-generating enzyme required for sulfatase activity